LRVSIDTCILLDLLLDQNRDSIGKLEKHHQDHDELIICGLVYGELYPFFVNGKMDIDLFLSEIDIAVEDLTKQDFGHAGTKWRGYCKRRRFRCPSCGRVIKLNCPHCHEQLSFRQHIISDFIIGAFSELHSEGILTRDYGYYKTYFPDLKRL
jgi:predicted nucleic acid-binding protein